MPVTAWLQLALFMALLLALALHGLAASGHFPRQHRSPAFASPLGAAVLFGSILMAVACLAVAVSTAWRTIPWYAAIIGGGLVLLVAPLLLRPLPDAFVNGRIGLVLFAGIAMVLTLAMIWAA